MTSCAVCKSWTGLSVCTGCRGTWYCGGEHQKAHWKSHKTVCKGIQAAVAAGGMHKDVITPGAGPVPQHGARVQCQYVGTVRTVNLPCVSRALMCLRALCRRQLIHTRGLHGCSFARM